MVDEDWENMKFNNAADAETKALSVESPKLANVHPLKHGIGLQT